MAKDYVGSFLDFVDGISGLFTSAFLAKTPQELIDIVGIQDNETFIVKGNSLLSVIEIQGTKGVVGKAEFTAITKAFDSKIKKYFLNEVRHNLKVIFESDPDASEEMLDDNFAATKAHLKRCKLDMDFVLDEKVDVNKKLTQREKIWFCFYTSPDKHVDKIEDEAEGGSFGLTQTFIRCNSLTNYHSACMDSLFSGLNQFLVLKRLDVDSVLIDIFGAINGTSSGKRLYFDKLVPSERDKKRIRDLDVLPNVKIDDVALSKRLVAQFTRELDEFNIKTLSPLLPEPLAEQLITGACYDDGRGTVVSGARIYAPLVAHSIGVDRKDFDHLVKYMSGYPFRIAFNFSSDGLKMGMFESFAMSILGTANKKTKLKAHAINALKSISQSDAIIGISVSALTWAPLDKRIDLQSGKAYYDTTLLDKRVERFKMAANDWCGLKLSSCAGDSVECLFSTLPGLIKGHVGKRASAPLMEAASLLPISRAGSVWDQGTMTFRTPDGRPFFFHQMSSKQASDVMVITGEMGTGKSSLMSALDLAFLMQPSDTPDLPYLRGLEFGYSQSGLVEAIQAGLPDDEKHRAQYVLFKNDKSFAVNVHDLDLSLRKPLDAHRAFLINFLQTLTNAMADYPNHAGLCGKAVDLAYDFFSDKDGNPNAKRYSRGADDVVDRYLEEYGIPHKDALTPWFEIADRLFMHNADKNGNHPNAWLAARARRHAMPTIEDYQIIANSAELTNEYDGDYRGTTPCKAFALAIRESIPAMQMICGVSTFDVSDSPVFIADLKDLIPSGEQKPAIQARSAIFYMAVMRALSADFFVDESIVQLYASSYRAYHAKRIDRITRSKKRFFVDEKHRINSIPSASAAVDAIVFEGRKFKISVIQGSQLLTHISSAIIKLATTVICCGSSSDEEAEEAKKRYSLTDYHKKLIMELEKPSKLGGEFFVRFKLGNGTACYKLINTEGPIMLCLVATDASDRAVRQGLVQIAKHKPDAWRAYAAEFPSGRITDEVDRRNSLAAIGQYESRFGDILKDIILDIAVKYKLM